MIERRLARSQSGAAHMGACMQRTVIEPLPQQRMRFKVSIEKDGAREERAIYRFHLFNTIGESVVFDWLVNANGDRAAQVELTFEAAAVARTEPVFNAEKLFYIDQGLCLNGQRYADIWLHESLLPRRLLDETPIFCEATVVRMLQRYQVVGHDAWFETVTDPRTEPRILDNAEVNETLVEVCSKVAELSPNDKNDAWL